MASFLDDGNYESFHSEKEVAGSCEDSLEKQKHIESFLGIVSSVSEDCTRKRKWNWDSCKEDSKLGIDKGVDRESERRVDDNLRVQNYSSKAVVLDMEENKMDCKDTHEGAAVTAAVVVYC
eukprot:TRINITY_DN2574_c0_g2_i1.p2 TRINITY_DN2574_c0_g2~~TRINITY_DN2574_c0_g2_i1.p2  ORF type:complete len:121 (-),score=15.46 TRINITY_DN2574_c0_g2_i1:181-543(-)